MFNMYIEKMHTRTLGGSLVLLGGITTNEETMTNSCMNNNEICHSHIRRNLKRFRTIKNAIESKYKIFTSSFS